MELKFDKRAEGFEQEWVYLSFDDGEHWDFIGYYNHPGKFNGLPGFAGLAATDQKDVLCKLETIKKQPIHCSSIMLVPGTLSGPKAPAKSLDVDSCED